MFNELLDLALASAKEILETKLDQDHKSFDKLLTRKTSIATAVLSTTARVNEATLRGKKKDRVDELLAAIKAEGG